MPTTASEFGARAVRNAIQPHTVSELLDAFLESRKPQSGKG